MSLNQRRKTPPGLADLLSKELLSGPMPYGQRVLAAIRIVLYCVASIKKLLIWITLIASTIFFVGLPVAVATNNTSAIKTFLRFIADPSTKEQSSTQEVLPPLELDFLPPLKQGK